MENLTVILDGITMQQAGELLFDSKISSEQRRRARETYIHCLEAFAFALAYGSNFSVSGSLPKVGDEKPGSLLRDEYRGKLKSLKPGRVIGRPEEIIFNPRIRKRIKSDLEILDDALFKGRSYWNHYMIREVQSYLGEDPSLNKNSIEPELYVFNKTPTFIADRELQSFVPESFIQRMLETIESNFDTQHKSKEALREFVTQNLLTHITIFWWYEEAARDTIEEGGLRMPHCTRELVRTVQSKNEREKFIVDTYSLLGRHALFDAVNRAINRKEVIDKLHILPEIEPYPTMRKSILELFNVVSSPDEAKSMKYLTMIQQEIWNLSSKTPGLRDTIDIQAEFGSKGLSAKVLASSKQISDIKYLFSKPKRALRKFFNYSKLDSNEQYLKTLNNIFPELELEKT